jgi:hypothetical protein
MDELDRMPLDDIATTIDWLDDQKTRESDAINK